ncbi:hypothetical protein NW762_003610 [Fusarium torreyae]|uniref:Uncharacterized protein n=1 Tax=Fusarium torreyae TaxID=1237075 RepID=A0A9W8SAM3_9HYPO|nr:hypothetical protein NW762_003610 [Fusarium torreyae]
MPDALAATSGGEPPARDPFGGGSGPLGHKAPKKDRDPEIVGPAAHVICPVTYGQIFNYTGRESVSYRLRRG